MAAQTAQPQPLPPKHDDDVQDWTQRVTHVMNSHSHITGPKPAGRQPWHSAFFGCFDPIDTCLITWCCPCVTFGKTHHRLRKDPNLSGYSPVNVTCLGFWASMYCCLSWVPQLIQQNEIQDKFNLDADFPMDCLKICCCGCCVIIQNDKEAEYHLANTTVDTIQPGLKEEMMVPA